MVMMMVLMVIVKSTSAPIYCLIWLVRFGRSPAPLTLFTYRGLERAKCLVSIVTLPNSSEGRHYYLPALEIRKLWFKEVKYSPKAIQPKGAKPDLVPWTVCSKQVLLTHTLDCLPGGLQPLSSGTILVNGSVPHPA